MPAQGGRQNLQDNQSASATINQESAAAVLKKERNQERKNTQQGSEPVEDVSQENIQAGTLNENSPQPETEAGTKNQEDTGPGTNDARSSQVELQKKQNKERIQDKGKFSVQSEDTEQPVSKGAKMEVGIQIWSGLIIRDVMFLTLSLIPIIGTALSSPFVIVGLVFVGIALFKNIKRVEFAKFFAEKVIGEHGAWIGYLFIFSHTLAVAFVKFDYELVEGKIKRMKKKMQNVGDKVKSAKQKGKATLNKLKNAYNK